jgi:hypothetical protein
MDDHGYRLQSHLARLMLCPERYLTAALAEITDEVLAEAIGANPALVWRLRLMSWPRAHCWERDVYELALVVKADPGRLGAVLRRLHDPGTPPPMGGTAAKCNRGRRGRSSWSRALLSTCSSRSIDAPRSTA